MSSEDHSDDLSSFEAYLAEKEGAVNTDIKEIHDHLMEKIEDEWFGRLMSGERLVVYQDGTYEITEGNTDELDRDDSVKYVVWEGRSRDGLINFVRTMLISGFPDDIKDLLEAPETVPLLISDELFEDYFLRRDPRKGGRSEKFYTSNGILADGFTWEKASKNLEPLFETEDEDDESANADADASADAPMQRRQAGGAWDDSSDPPTPFAPGFARTRR